MTVLIVLSSDINLYFFKDYSHLSFLDIMVDVTLSLNNAPENIGLKSETNATQVRSFY